MMFRIGLFPWSHQAAFEGSDGFLKVSIILPIIIIYDHDLCGQNMKIYYVDCYDYIYFVNSTVVPDNIVTCMTYLYM